MRQRWIPAVACLLLANGVSARASQVLDLDDPTPRFVFVDVETSTNPATLGTSYGLRFIGSFTRSGDIASVRLSPQATTQFLEFAIRPPFNPPSVSQPLELRIDVASGAVEAEAAGGVTWVQDECQPNGNVVESYALDATTARVAGFTSAADPMLCALKDEWADYCAGSTAFACGLVPFMNPTLPYALCSGGTSFCPVPSCSFVPAATFDPATGKLHAVGYRASLQSSACGGSLVVRFAKRTDLRLLEAEYLGVPNVPSLGPGALPALAALLASCGALCLRRRSPPLDRAPGLSYTARP